MVNFRDILKDISHCIRNATVDSEGQNAVDAIELFLDEQTSAIAGSTMAIHFNDGQAIENLSRELILLYRATIGMASTFISNRPEVTRVHTQHYILLRCVRALIPIFKPNLIFQEWWSLLKPILSHSHYSYRVKKETRMIIAESLMAEQELIMEGELSDSIWFYKILEYYLEGQEEEDSGLDKTNTLRKQHQKLFDMEQNEWLRNLNSILLSVGAVQTKNFFSLLNKYYLKRQYRLQVVYLLNEFTRQKRTHLHELLDTPLFDSLLKSLMYDNSTTLIALSVTNLIMLLPRICTSLPPYLPRLFYIFARALCWDQLRDLRKKQIYEINHLKKNGALPEEWDCVDYTFSKLSAPPSNPQTGSFFTSLYGLYPCNFLKFLSKPYAYFKEMNFVVPEEFDEETFKHRTILQVTRHMLHPNLVMMDAESELKDKTRLTKMEPPDVIAQIMGLDLTNAASRVAFTEHQQHEHPILDTPGSSVKETNSIKKKDEIIENEIKNTVQMNRDIKSGNGEHVWGSSGATFNTSSPPLLMIEFTPDSVPSETKLLLAALKREVLLLRNELNFELFLKQQHLQHIGLLHRDHVLETSVEAERQQLYNTTKMLKTQLSQTTQQLEKMKSEMLLVKQKHIKWEEELSSKLNDYRQARKEWRKQLEGSQYLISEYERQLDTQNSQLAIAEKRIFELENELSTLEPTVKKMNEYEHQVKQLTQKLLLWEEDTARMEEQKCYIKALLSKWWSMEELVTSLQSENTCLNKDNIACQENIEKLKIELNECKLKLKLKNKNIPFTVDKKSDENKRLQKQLNELKLRLDALEVEKLEREAELETLCSV